MNQKADISFSMQGNIQQWVQPDVQDQSDQIDSFQEAKKKAPTKMTKIEIANSKSEKYYKQFDFFFNRSCFRIMTEFYKEKFNKFYKSKLQSLKKSDP